MSPLQSMMAPHRPNPALCKMIMCRLPIVPSVKERLRNPPPVTAQRFKFPIQNPEITNYHTEKPLFLEFQQPAKMI